jgi:hypothetical protein
VPEDFRCSMASRADDEPLAGTAPTDRAFLFVEHVGPWGRVAPELLDEFVEIPDGVRPQLIRRHARGAAEESVAVIAAWRDGHGFTVEAGRLRHHEQLAELDLTALAEGRSPGLTPYPDPLWLVCTNGRRDLCCAELGRPVAAALTEAWPEDAWETTHLGGHRFSATLLALPSGLTLGRLDPSSVVSACREVQQGRLPAGVTRGRAGATGPEQYAEIAMAAEHPDLPVRVVGSVPGQADDLAVVQVETGGAVREVVVRTAEGAPRRQSCLDLEEKPARVYDVVTARARS